MNLTIDSLSKTFMFIMLFFRRSRFRLKIPDFDRANIFQQKLSIPVRCHENFKSKNLSMKQFDLRETFLINTIISFLITVA